MSGTFQKLGVAKFVPNQRHVMISSQILRREAADRFSHYVTDALSAHIARFFSGVAPANQTQRKVSS